MNPSDFRSPPDEYREIPFWSWNDRLEEAEMRRQIELFQKGGWGGFFMHARVGLRTPYLGPEWMACVRACIAQAERLGLDAWLYDEDKWPSGFAGGLSVAGKADYRAQYLVCKLDDRPALLEERLATYLARLENGQVVEVTALEAAVETTVAHDQPAVGTTALLSTDVPIRSDQRVLQFYAQTMPIGDPNWFNGFAYLNLLNPEAVGEFIATTHEVYRREVGANFGGVVPGVFTDEPCTYFRVSRSASPDVSIPWERRLPAIFRAHRGYDLIPHLPSLFFDVGEYPKIRYDYWRTVTEQFVTAYSRQIFNWCEQNNLQLTGHYMSEDTMLTQIQWGLAAAMPHYAYMHIPGVDKLGRQIGKIYGTILTVKQLDSAACQLGKERALVENYALSGQAFAHQGRKWLADWAAVLGANVHNLHLALYSMRGERKRDCPPNLSYQQPWWPENPLIADYVARLSYALSQGQRVVDILVIHPMGSAWALYKPGGVAQVDDLDSRLDALLTILLAHQRDFHLGDELMMQPGGVCEARVIVETAEHRTDELYPPTDELYPPRRPIIQVGKMSYRMVIVPSGVTLASSTVHLLEEFSSAGGRILTIEPAPTLIDGCGWGYPPTDRDICPPQSVLPTAQSATLTELLALLDDADADVRVGRPSLPFDVHITDGYADTDGYSVSAYPSVSASRTAPHIWVHHRRSGDVETYFLANVSLEQGGVACVQLNGIGLLEEWDLASGEIHPLEATSKDGITEVTLEFAPAQSHLLVLHPHQIHRIFGKGSPDARFRAPSFTAGYSVSAEFILPNDWQLTLGAPNAITLECASLQIGADRGGLDRRGELDRQWQSPQDILAIQALIAGKGVGTPFGLRFTFDADVAPSAPVSLVLESPQAFEISVNGEPVSVSENPDWWVDYSFKKVDITPAVRAGRNQIELHSVFGLETELEAVYLFGDFGVEAKRLRRENRYNGMWFDRYSSAMRLVKAPNRVYGIPTEDGIMVDLTAQGLPHFAGRARLSQKIVLPEVDARPAGRVFLEFDHLRAAVANVEINGQPCGSLAWQPHRLDVTAALRPGENEIVLELVNTLRNLLGPHHLSGGEMDYTGPDAYSNPRLWTDDMILVPFGFDAVRLIFE